MQRARLGMGVVPALQRGQVLAPVDVAVIQMEPSAIGTADQFVEVRQLMQRDPQAAGDEP